MAQMIKIFTRKELKNWIEIQNGYKFQQLKNGLFFCQKLIEKFPEDVQKIKYNTHPKSDYDFTNNLKLMKKTLNRYSLQLNLNINTILLSKQNYQFTNWFKNFVDGIIKVQIFEDLQGYSEVKHYEQRLSQTGRLNFEKNRSSKTERSSSKKRKSCEQINIIKRNLSRDDSPHKKGIFQTSNVDLMGKGDQLLKDKKPPLPSRKLRQNKIKKYNSEQQMIKIDMSGSMMNLNNFENQQKIDNIENQFKDIITDDIYQSSLEESIEGLKKIIEKVRKISKDETQTSIENYKMKIIKAIYQK